jgi:hypothetical protein
MDKQVWRARRNAHHLAICGIVDWNYPYREPKTASKFG